MMYKILAVIFSLFLCCFVAIIIEETFLGGRRLRRLQKKLRESRAVDKE